MRIHFIIGLTLALIGLPLGVGYATAPCDSFSAPVVLSLYRLRQQRFLTAATRWADEVEAVGLSLDAIARGPQPQSTGAAFRLAEQVGQAAGRLNALILPEAPAEYSLLALTMQQTADTYAYAAEQLLIFYGNNDGQALAEAQASLALARLALGDLRAGIAGLTYPACREVWRE
ncbi:MAG TPA: hypothetical protein PKV20_02570 [Anaerolineae bacterium]|mgnify:FL=1|nr:hypothetical protein [Anaerolineae bacterium]